MAKTLTKVMIWLSMTCWLAGGSFLGQTMMVIVRTIMTSNNNIKLHDYNSATLLLIVKMMLMPIQMMPMLMLDLNDADAYVGSK